MAKYVPSTSFAVKAILVFVGFMIIATMFPKVRVWERFSA